MIDQQKLDSQLMLDEGLRLKPYRDSRGYLSTGAGRNLDTNPLTPAEIAVCGHDGRTQPITLAAAIFLLHNDEATAMNELTTNCGWWVNLDDVRARVMIDLMFNMGWGTLQNFHHFLADMACKSFDTAADDLKDSAWYNEVGDRGPRLVRMVRTGSDYDA